MKKNCITVIKKMFVTWLYVFYLLDVHNESYVTDSNFCSSNLCGIIKIIIQ